MTLLGRLFTRGAAAVTPAAAAPLFDADFQRKLELLALVARKLNRGRQRGERRTRQKGSGVEFADHRDYAPGDDIRHVDWAIYRRFGRLLIKLHEEEEDLTVYILVDTSASMAFAGGRKFDQARRLAAALAWVALANLDRVAVLGLAAPSSGDSTATAGGSPGPAGAPPAPSPGGSGARLAPTRGKGRVFRVLRFLERLRAGGRTDLAAALTTFVARHPRRGIALLITDLYDPAGFERGINVLRYHRFEPRVLHLIDRRETHPSLGGELALIDCETGDRREVTVTPALLARLEAARRAWVADVERFCVGKQVPYAAVDVDQPFDEVVLGLLRRGGFLR